MDGGWHRAKRSYEDAVKTFQPYDRVKEPNAEARAAGSALIAAGKEAGQTKTLKLDLLVLPQARSLPVASMGAMRAYLRGGGRMMALGLPAWDSPTFAFNGKSLSKQDYQRLLDAQVADHTIVETNQEKRWHSLN